MAVSKRQHPKYNKDRWPLAPIIEKLEKIIKEQNITHISKNNSLRISPKTLDNILNGKCTPSLEQFKLILDKCKLECVLITTDSETQVIELEHNSIKEFITNEMARQSLTEQQLEKDAQLNVHTLRKIKQSNRNYNMETLVRIFKALGYTLDIRPKSIKEDEKAAVPSALGSDGAPKFPFTGKPAVLSNDDSTPNLAKGQKSKK